MSYVFSQVKESGCPKHPTQRHRVLGFSLGRRALSRVSEKFPFSEILLNKYKATLPSKQQKLKLQYLFLLGLPYWLLTPYKPGIRNDFLVLSSGPLSSLPEGCSLFLWPQLPLWWCQTPSFHSQTCPLALLINAFWEVIFPGKADRWHTPILFKAELLNSTLSFSILYFYVR